MAPSMSSDEAQVISLKLAEKYRKVRALAKEGEGGEREAAVRVLAQLEQDHPGIREIALHGSDIREAANTSHLEGGNWENIYGFVRSAYATATRVADVLVDAQRGRGLADEVEATHRVSSAGNLLLGFRMSLDVYQRVLELTPTQLNAFRQSLHTQLDMLLDDLFLNE